MFQQCSEDLARQGLVNRSEVVSATSEQMELLVEHLNMSPRLERLNGQPLLILPCLALARLVEPYFVFDPYLTIDPLFSLSCLALN